ncbi:MAG: hypothetical protein WCI73_17690, partial [Phycisphaerae bacterium]
YGVYSLAVDRMSPQTVYAATEGGLCKSADGGEQWRLLPLTGPKELRITGERNKSIRAIAVDPTDSKVVYAGSPGGKVYKSIDGGQTWKAVYEQKIESADLEAERVQFGKTNEVWHGGIWIPFKFPAEVKSEDCVGFGFSFKGDGTQPEKSFVTLRTTTGAAYTSKQLGAIFKDNQWRDIVLTASDFTLDAEYVKKNPDQAKVLGATLDWSTVNRMDLACVGPPTEAHVGKLKKVFFALTRSADGQTGTAEKPILVTVREFSKNKTIPSYGNIRLGNPPAGTIYTVAVSPQEPAVVLAATNDSGVVLSSDGGQTWSELKTPKMATSVAVAASDPNIIYGGFAKDGVWKSTDKGLTWTSVSQGISKECAISDVAVSPANPLNVYAIGAKEWNGRFYYSNDGGQTWKESSQVVVDADSGDPTLPSEAPTKPGLSAPTNLAINPLNPKEIYISANWRPCLSADGGRTLTERVRGADISCVYDIRFSGPRTYVAAMDEGTLVSENNGQNWRQLWPLKFDVTLGGHNWRLAVNRNNGEDRILCAVSPWDERYPDRMVVSADGGKTHQVVTAGLPNYIIHPNTMWGRGYARALAVDPQNPLVVYLGIDGDAEAGKSGGGIFKSVDGGSNWKQMAHQPGSRRMFFGLAVDPTDSQRLFWGA